MVVSIEEPTLEKMVEIGSEMTKVPGEERVTHLCIVSMVHLISLVNKAEGQELLNQRVQKQSNIHKSMVEIGTTVLPLLIMNYIINLTLQWNIRMPDFL